MRTDDFHPPARLRKHAVAAMRTAAPTGDAGLDSPFSGCYGVEVLSLAMSTLTDLIDGKYRTPDIAR